MARGLTWTPMSPLGSKGWCDHGASERKMGVALPEPCVVTAVGTV